MAKDFGLVIIVICCCLLLMGGGITAGLYYGNVTCPSFGASCSPGPAPGPAPAPAPVAPPTTCPAGKYLSGNNCVVCPGGGYKTTTSTLQSDCLTVPPNAFPTNDQSDWVCQPNYVKNTAGTGCQWNGPMIGSYYTNAIYYPDGYYDSTQTGNMTVAAAKTLLSSTQGGSDPIIGFTCNSSTYADCTNITSGTCQFIRQSKTPLPYPNWPNNYGCTYLRNDINPGW